MKRIHGGDARESLDKVVLFAAFIVGAGGTVWLKIFEVNALVVALFPVVVLLAYVGACLKLRSLGTEPETIGDNSYYLGFLFTLASLSVTLYTIRHITTEDVDLIPLVISGFGVALSSTIAGVFLRVFLLQLRPDIVARDREARRDLAAGARDLREAMAHASRQLKTVAIETQQHVAERNGRMSEVLEVQAARTSELLDRQSQAYEKVIEEFGRRLSEDVTTVFREESGRVAEELNLAAKGFRENLEALSRARAAAESEFVSSLAAFGEVVDEIRKKSAERDRAMEAAHGEIAKRSQKASQALEEVADTVQSAVSMSRLVVEEAQRAVGESRSKVREEEARFRGHVHAVVRAMGELEGAITGHVEEISRHRMVNQAPHSAARLPASLSPDSGMGSTVPDPRPGLQADPEAGPAEPPPAPSAASMNGANGDGSVSVQSDIGRSADGAGEPNPAQKLWGRWGF